MPFIAFEGLDGSGKSTLIDSIRNELVQQGQAVVVTREPGGTPLGEILRDLVTSTKTQAPTARAEALLYQAIRAQHVELVIQPALKKGEWVLCDRFRASSIAFQAGARGLEKKDIEWLNDFSTSGLQPDLTLLLDLTVEESSRRLKRRYESASGELDRFEKEKTDFHEKVRQSYLALSARSKDWVCLDSSESPAGIHQKVLNVLRERGWL